MLSYLLNFTINCLSVYFMYLITDHGLKKYNTRYSVFGKDTQEYIVSNITKSIVLFWLCSYYTSIIFSIIRNINSNDNQDTKLINNIALLYASTDFVNLFIVKKNKLSTILHHVFVNLLSFYSIYGEQFKQGSSWYLVVLYGIFSCYAYLVNGFLGMRFLYPKNHSTIRSIAKVSVFTYILSCAVNWSIQLYLNFIWWGELTNDDNLFKYLMYLVGIFVFVHDDIKLMKFLKDYSEQKIMMKKRNQGYIMESPAPTPRNIELKNNRELDPIAPIIDLKKTD
jgi:hypothetical protein